MIKFCGRTFSSPQLLLGFVAPKCPGVYCFMAGDPEWDPLPLRPVYFGMTHDFSGRIGWDHEAIRTWRTRGGNVVDLHVSLLQMDSERDRSAFEGQLIERYQPELNKQRTNRNWLAEIVDRGLRASGPKPMHASR